MTEYFLGRLAYRFLKASPFKYVIMLRESLNLTSIMQGISTLFTRPQFNSSADYLNNQINLRRKVSKLQQFFAQCDIDEALAEQRFLEQWITEHATEVNNALQTIQLSANNLFVVLGFINSIDVTLRKAVIVAFLQNE